jgi:Zn-dependent M28 family amino/carboxypeptidase
MTAEGHRCSRPEEPDRAEAVAQRGRRAAGSKRADEAVLYMAHWDHLGKHEGETGDNIYNGAVDNATGVAGILNRSNGPPEPKPERSVVFLAVTLEESGLLGSSTTLPIRPSRWTRSPA